MGGMEHTSWSSQIPIAATTGNEDPLSKCAFHTYSRPSDVSLYLGQGRALIGLNPGRRRVQTR